MEDFFDQVRAEREYQLSRGWNDPANTAGAWVCYIVNYASRFMMNKSFDPERYNFGNCMVKTGALALAAFEWWNNQDGDTDATLVPEAVQGSST